ncbi:leucine-rich repeat domain-containing protein [Candidatus Uabimicrobium amorphum]|uniref:Membrane protein n=1 Tax=Uabimicrobium amorphum TaxID=2596890 RepID=A0A5S9ITN8_UABAM|nr:hypothetical protein [Candidatus Uabimicrobium amorphum]BBM87899.1 membrane protein [Candidatus Uabimicrobium amorphum]
MTKPIKNRTLRNIKSDREYIQCTFHLDEKKAYSITNTKFCGCRFSSNVTFDFLDACTFEDCHFDQNCNVHVRPHAFPEKLHGLPSLKSVHIQGFLQPLSFLPFGSRHEERTKQNMNSDFFKSSGIHTSLTHLNVICYANIHNFLEAFTDLPSLREVHLNSVKCELSQDFTHLPLHRFVIENGEVTNVCNTIGQMTSLQHLAIHQATELRFPKQIGKLTSLQHLKLEHCVHLIPKEIGNLVSLTHLTIFTTKYNSRQSIPMQAFPNSMEVVCAGIPREIGKLVQLQQCCLHSNFTEVPQEFAMLTSLQKLTLSSQNCTSFPTVVCQLNSLTHLSLNMPISEIPKEISQLQSLTHLSFSGSDIRAIGKYIAKLTHLTHLKIYQNYAVKICEEIQQLTSLKRIEFCNCRISAQQKRQIKEWLPHCAVSYTRVGEGR